MNITPSIRLDGKVALVTGGGAGIGRAIVDAYAALGARVATIEVDAARAADLSVSLSEDHLIFEGDVRSAEMVAATFAAVADRFGDRHAGARSRQSVTASWNMRICTSIPPSWTSFMVPEESPSWHIAAAQ